MWKDQQDDAKRLRGSLLGVVDNLRSRLDRVEDAYLHERTIDRASYERQRDKLREELALAELELSGAVSNRAVPPRTRGSAPQNLGCGTSMPSLSFLSVP